MPFIKIWIHLVFAVKNREQLLQPDIRTLLFKHIIDYSHTKEIFINCIGGCSEHVHCLISLGCEQTTSKIVNLLKGESSHWINVNKMTNTKFEWADEYFASSVSESKLETVRQYIRNQEEHHRTKSFNEEYDEFMKRYGFKYLD